MSDLHRMIPGSHERVDGPECLCGWPWDRFNDQCVGATLTYSPYGVVIPPDPGDANYVGDPACVLESHIRSETSNLWCVTHAMWVDESADSPAPNARHERAVRLGLTDWEA